VWSHADTQAYTDAQAASYAAASPVVRTLFGLNGNSREAKLASSPPGGGSAFSEDDVALAVEGANMRRPASV
jgi:hypothetical protein